MAAKSKTTDTKNAIAVVDAKAIAPEVGNRALTEMAAAQRSFEKADAIKKQAQTKEYATLAGLTMVFVAASEIMDTTDNPLDLPAFVEQDVDKSRLSRAKDQLYLLLGLKAPSTPDATGKIYNRWTKTAIDKMIAQADNPKDYKKTKDGKSTITEPGQRKRTLFSNFSRQMVKAAQAALDIQERKLIASFNEDEGTLQISGPEVKAQFGIETVLLNERQKVKNDKGEETSLTVRPSFNRLASTAAERYGHTNARQSQARKTEAPAIDSDTAFKTLCVSLQKAMSKLKDKGLNAEQIKLVRSVCATAKEVGAISTYKA